MAGSICPHCGAKLPPVADAFCPECRGDLSEPKSNDAAITRIVAEQERLPSPEVCEGHTSGRPGFGARFLAYFIDFIPIALGVTLVLSVGFDLDAVPNRLLDRQSGGPDSRIEFIWQRQLIRDTTLLIYLVYSTLMDASRFQGTLGKRAVGIVVTDNAGRRIGIAQSIGRNLGKLVSFAACGLGCLWMLWSKEQKTWHDMMSSTQVGAPVSSNAV